METDDGGGARLAGGGLEDSAVSPFGRTPSANHTRLCSRVRTADGGNTHTQKAKVRKKWGGWGVCNKWLESNRGVCAIRNRAKSIEVPGPTLIPSLLKDPHRHHDGRRRRAQRPGGLGLLQGGDGGAVLRRVVGVRTLAAR